MGFAVPKILDTESTPTNEKILFEKYFRGHLNWFVAEKEGDKCFGYIQNLSEPMFSEWGYFNLKELAQVNAKKDNEFKPTKLAELEEPILHIADVIFVIKPPKPLLCPCKVI